MVVMYKYSMEKYAEICPQTTALSYVKYGYNQALGWVAIGESTYYIEQSRKSLEHLSVPLVRRIAF